MRGRHGPMKAGINTPITDIEQARRGELPTVQASHGRLDTQQLVHEVRAELRDLTRVDRERPERLVRRFLLVIVRQHLRVAIKATRTYAVADNDRPGSPWNWQPCRSFTTFAP
jgi:hypothetical protein